VVLLASILALVQRASPEPVILTAGEACATGAVSPGELCAPMNAGSPLAAVGVTTLLSEAACDDIVASAEGIAASPGNSGWRSILRFDTREMPMAEVPALRRWFDAEGRKALEGIVRAYHLPPAVRDLVAFDLGESNVIRYEAPLPGVGAREGPGEGGGTRAAVAPHVDGEDAWTFNVLLRDTSGPGPAPRDSAACDTCEGSPPCCAVQGPGPPGTYFPHLNATLRPRRGTAVTYYGGLVHSSGAPLPGGVRYVWQGFLTLRPARGGPVRGQAAGPTEQRAYDVVMAEAQRLAPALMRAGTAAFPRNGALASNLCAALGRESLPGAVEACRVSLALEPRASALNNLGLLQAAAGEAAAAEASFRAGLRLSSLPSTAPGDLAELYANLCSVLRESPEPARALEAVEACEAAVRLEPGSAPLLANLGVARQAHDPRGALEAYARALELDPWDTRARWNRGVLHLGTPGGGPDAARDFAAILEVDPDDPEARRALIFAESMAAPNYGAERTGAAPGRVPGLE